ncbi:MAG: hypothetical protein GY841_15300 [FCB group bacterium]|nr:hypothetical protein [FCB group bacterium]
MPYIHKSGALFTIVSTAICALLIFAGCGSDQKDEKADAMTPTVPQEINGWVLADSTESYDRETIFDYINGAGEVYLSFGYQQVNVYRLTKPDAPEIIVEIFDMGTAEDAFGIFSYAREGEESGIGGGYEYRGSLLCFWQDRFYVCVLCYEQSDEAKTATYKLARQISDQIPPTTEKPDLVRFLPEEKLIPNSVRFFHVQPTLNYHYFLSEENILGLNRDTRAALAEYGSEGMHLLVIEYASDEKAAVGHNGFLDGYIPEAKSTGAAKIETGRWVAVQQLDRRLIICFDASSEDEAQQTIEAYQNKMTE